MPSPVCLNMSCRVVKGMPVNTDCTMKNTCITGGVRTGTELAVTAMGLNQFFETIAPATKELPRCNVEIMLDINAQENVAESASAIIGSIAANDDVKAYIRPEGFAFSVDTSAERALSLIDFFKKGRTFVTGMPDDKNNSFTIDKADILVSILGQEQVGNLGFSGLQFATSVWPSLVYANVNSILAGRLSLTDLPMQISKNYISKVFNGGDIIDRNRRIKIGDLQSDILATLGIPDIMDDGIFEYGSSMMEFDAGMRLSSYIIGNFDLRIDKIQALKDGLLKIGDSKDVLLSVLGEPRSRLYGLWEYEGGVIITVIDDAVVKIKVLEPGKGLIDIRP